MSQIVKLMSVNPRKILGLSEQTLSVGCNADITIVDLEKEWVVNPDEMKSKARNSVFKGEKLKGKVIYTISDGTIIFSENK